MAEPGSSGDGQIWTAHVSAAPAAAVGSALTGYALGITQHVFYLGGDGHVRELWWDSGSGWHLNDLMTGVPEGAPGAAAGSALTGYVLGNTQHVFYLGADNHVHELWRNPGSGWHPNDLMTAAAGAPQAAAGSALTGCTLGNTQHVFYLGADRHVRELWWDPESGWHSNDLMTATAGEAPNAASGSALTSYALGIIQHVFYLDTDSHVHELWWDPGSGWHPNDLMAGVAGGAPSAVVRSALMGYAMGIIQHVFYVGADSHVHALRRDPRRGWHSNDLMMAAGAPHTAAGSALTGYVLGNTQHVFYLGPDRHVHELWWDPVSRWRPKDLMTGVAEGAPHAAAESALTGYVLGNAQHVFYLGADRRVYELWWDPVGGWHPPRVIQAV
ncbi:MAG TPA: hypothetical protein VFW01_03505 [bacterium]|nr:hypothetical protein [bacterium]